MKLTSTLLSNFTFPMKVGQRMKLLKRVFRWNTNKAGYAIVFGNFIQRLGFTSGGFGQQIQLINIDTQEIVRFTVKPTFKTTKQNSFAYFIKPGNYAILNYWWIQSKWYGGKSFLEPIFQNVDSTNNFNEKLKSGELKAEELVVFTFTISENSLNYLGNWHFDTGLVSFTDDKIAFEKKISPRFKKLDFSQSKLVLPN